MKTAIASFALLAVFSSIPCEATYKYDSRCYQQDMIIDPNKYIVCGNAVIENYCSTTERILQPVAGQW
ncbi:hypothetical protein BGZ49_004394, partial [Haplosporangium sp. Z 27]